GWSTRGTPRLARLPVELLVRSSPDTSGPKTRGQAYNGEGTTSSLELTAERGVRLRVAGCTRSGRRIFRENHSCKGSRWIPTNSKRSKPRSKARWGGSSSIDRTD